MDLNGLTIAKTHEGLKTKQFSAIELTRDFLARVKNKDKEIHAYLSITEKLALEEAVRIDAKIADGLEIGVFEGVPCAIKDNILIEGTKCTAGSKILANYVAPYDATVIRKLKKAGAIFLGKTNMDEFAMGSSTENSAFGPTKNPHDLERVPGGSSGGSAAAVAADLCVFALGSDTGGSIRQPASLCGVVGLKPTYGRVSRHGLIALASSLDQIGPITKNVYDTALVLNTICGQDKFDSTTVSREVPDFTKNLDKSIKGLRVGVPKEYFTAPTGRQDEGLSSEVRISVQNYISELEKLGCEISEISLPHSEYALAVYYIIMPSEVSSNLARFDGIRYGHSSQKSKTLLEVYENSRSEGFGAEPKRRIMLGTFALSSGYYDAYYLKAQKVRSLIKKDFD